VTQLRTSENLTAKNAKIRKGRKTLREVFFVTLAPALRTLRFKSFYSNSAPRIVSPIEKAGQLDTAETAAPGG